MTRPLLTASLLAALVVAWSTVASGQVITGGSGTSAFGGGFGSSGFGSSSFGSGRFGGAGFGATRFGSGGIGTSGFGASPFGSSGLGMSGFGGGGLGSSGFGGSGLTSGFGGYGGGQNFVGRDSADIAATFNQMGQAGAQFFNQMNRDMGRRNRDGQSAPSEVENAPQPMRVSIQVGFDVPRPAPQTIVSNLQARLGSILAAHDIAQPVLSVEGDTVVLRGVAATESQRLMLERLIGLEPGVRQVRNEMTVAEPPAAEALRATRSTGN
jgi:hypothetical protein